MNHIFFLLVIILPSVYPDCQWGSGDFTIGIGNSTIPIKEDVSQDVVLWSEITTAQMNVDETGESEEFKDLLKYEFTATQFIIKAGAEFQNYIDKKKDDTTPLSFFISLGCEGGGMADPPGAIIQLFISPENNKVPEFQPSDTIIIPNIAIPWNTDIPLNFEYPLIVSDEDFSVGEITSVELRNPGNFTVTWDATTGSVKLFSKVEIFGDTTIEIIAKDGIDLHEKTMEVQILTATATTTESPTTMSTESPTTTTTTATPTTSTTTAPPTTTTERISTSDPLPECPPYEIGQPATFFPGISCDSYYVCAEGGIILMYCPRPLFWDQSIKACAHPGSVICDM